MDRSSWAGLGLASDGDVVPGERDIRYVALDWIGSHVLVQARVKNVEQDRDELRTILWDVKSRTFQVLPEDSAKKDISFGDPAQSPDGKLVAVRSLHEGLAIRDPDASCALTATLSPDGRWLAAVVGARDAPVVAWDLNLPDTAEPARSLDAVCNLEESNCIRRLCDKIFHGSRRTAPPRARRE